MTSDEFFKLINNTQVSAISVDNDRQLKMELGTGSKRLHYEME